MYKYSGTLRFNVCVNIYVFITLIAVECLHVFRNWSSKILENFHHYLFYAWLYHKLLFYVLPHIVCNS